jgi:hypothetical protein
MAVGRRWSPMVHGLLVELHRFVVSGYGSYQCQRNHVSFRVSQRD